MPCRQFDLEVSERYSVMRMGRRVRSHDFRSQRSFAHAHPSASLRMTSVRSFAHTHPSASLGMTWIFCAAFALPLFAQSVTSPVAGETITVTATRTESRLGDTAA